MNNKKVLLSIIVYVYDIFLLFILKIFRVLVGCYRVYVVK